MTFKGPGLGTTMLKHSSQHKTPSKQKNQISWVYFLAWVCGDIGEYQCALVLLLKVLAADQCVNTCTFHICVWGMCISQIGFETWSVDFSTKLWFFPHDLPARFCNRAVFQFVVSLICGVSVLDMPRGASVVEFHIDCACWDHSLSWDARLRLFSHTFGCTLGKACFCASRQVGHLPQEQLKIPAEECACVWRGFVCLCFVFHPT